MKDPKQIIKLLPESWNDITLDTFQKLTSILINEDGDVFDGIENSLQVISKLTNIDVEELEELPLRDLHILGNRISFMTELPKESKSSLTKWKKAEEITYNNYINFIQIPPEKQLENLHVFVKNFSKTPLTEEEILMLPIPDVMQGFFLYRKQLRKSVKHSIRCLILKVVKQRLRNWVQGLKQKISRLGKVFIK